MKKSIISVSILLVLFLTLGVICCYAFPLDKEGDAENTQPNKILENYKRVKEDINSFEDEELSSYVTDENIEISEKSKALLEYFGKDLSGTKTVKKIHKKDLCITVTRVITENMEVEFDENGDIVEYQNYDDFSKVGKDKKDYKEGQKLPIVKYEIDDVSKIQGIVSMLEKLSYLEGYKMIDCSNNIQGAWILTWVKEYEGGITNSYDNCNVVVDAKDGSIWLYGKNAMLPNTTKPVISEALATAEATNLAKTKYGDCTLTSVKLSFTRPNFYFEEGGPYERANFVRLCYEVSMDNGVTVHIDAETGEVLGGDRHQTREFYF